MYIPFDQHVAHQDTLQEFLAEVRAAFETALASYERTVSADEFFADMETAKFSFEVSNGYLAEAVLEDTEQCFDN